MPDTPVLELNDATVVKGDRRVLDGLTLTIHAGQHTAILGPNGAGKSVLVNLLTHQDRPLASDAGPPPVRVFGCDVWNVFDLRLRFGIVSSDLHHRFVGGNSEGWITGEAAVLSGFFASQGILRYGIVTGEMRRKAADALARMGVGHLAPRRLNEMSSGEARRVLLARALVTAPRALVLDEPTTGLDLVARHAFMERVRQIVRPAPGAGGPQGDGEGDTTTLILITHHVEEIVPEIEQVILLRHGRIAAAGPKREILTAARLGELFDAPVVVEEADGYYYARLQVVAGGSSDPPATPPSGRASAGLWQAARGSARSAPARCRRR